MSSNRNPNGSRTPRSNRNTNSGSSNRPATPATATRPQQPPTPASRPPITPSRMQQPRRAPAPQAGSNVALIAVIATLVIFGGLAAFIFLPGLFKGGQNAPLAFDSNLPQIATLTPTTTEGSEVIFPSQGGQHVSDAEIAAFKYNSSPPTSGVHNEVFPPSFVSSSPMGPKYGVHMLEHGNVLVFYNCNCPDLVDKLKKFAAKYDNASQYQGQSGLTAEQVAIESGDTVLVAPYPNMKQRIAVMAWRRMLNMDVFDEARADAFVQKYKKLGASIDNATPPITPPQP